MTERETRFTTSDLEIRSQGDKVVIQGYASVFNRLSQNLGGFVETVRKGAFAKTVQEADVRSYFNHDKSMILGRTKSGTLKVAEDANGLHYEVAPGNQTYARDLMEAIERGDVDGSSFGFRVVGDGEAWNFTDAGLPLRELRELRLLDVSPVTEPAYLDATAGLGQRSLHKLVELRGWDAASLGGLDAGLVLKAALEGDEHLLEHRSSEEPEAQEPEARQEQEPEPVPDLAIYRSRLHLAKTYRPRVA